MYFSYFIIDLQYHSAVYCITLYLINISPCILHLAYMPAVQPSKQMVGCTRIMTILIRQVARMHLLVKSRCWRILGKMSSDTSCHEEVCRLTAAVFKLLTVVDMLQTSVVIRMQTALGCKSPVRYDEFTVLSGARADS